MVSPDLCTLQKKSQEDPDGLRAPDEGDIHMEYSSDQLCSQSIGAGSKKKNTCNNNLGQYH